MCRNVVIVSLWALLCVSAQASAQVCFGGASFAGSAVHVGAIFGADAAAITFGGQALVGHGRTGLFGAATVAGQTVDGFDGTGALVEGIVGVDIAAGRTKRLYLCPVASGLFQAGPALGGNDVSVAGATGGASVGVVVYESARGVRAVLTGGFIGVHQRLTLQTAEEKTAVTDNFAVARLGVGFVFKRMTVVPTLQFPVALEGGDPSIIYGIGVAFLL